MMELPYAEITSDVLNVMYLAVINLPDLREKNILKYMRT